MLKSSQAVQTDSLLQNTPGALEPKFREGFVAKGHSFCMILIDTAARIREAVDDPVLTRQIDESIAELRRDFMKPEFKAILETVGPNGEFIDSIPGRTINPGHSIETAWFILEEAKHRNWDPQLKQIGLTILNWSWEWGWDKTHGGITYFRDCKNRPQQEYWHDMKFWWPQCEAIIATLYAYEATGDPKYLEMHKQINEYTYARFPDKEYGEWFGYFHYDGTLSQPAKGNMYKGPFHIPRMLLKCHLYVRKFRAMTNNKKYYPWIVVALLWGVALLNYMDRQMLSTMKSAMMIDITELESATNFGRLMAVFLWIYGLMSPVAGMIADRINRKWLIVGSLFVWSFVTLMMGYSTDFNQIYILRAIMGCRY